MGLRENNTTREELPVLATSQNGRSFTEVSTPTIPDLQAIRNPELYLFFEKELVCDLNFYELILKFRNQAPAGKEAIDELISFIKFPDNLSIILEKLFSISSDLDFSASLSKSEEEISDFIDALMPKLKELMRKDSHETINSVFIELSTNFCPIEVYLCDIRVKELIKGYFVKTSEFILNEIKLIEDIQTNHDSHINCPEFISATIAHLISDFGTEASMQQLFALIVDRAYAEGIDANTLIEFLKRDSIIRLLLNRVLFFANEGYFENGKKPVTEEIRTEINAYVQYFANNYKPNYQKNTFIATIKKIVLKYKEYDVLAVLKDYLNYRLIALLNSRIPTVVDNLYIEVCRQRLEKRDEDETTKMKSIAKTQFSKIFQYFDSTDNPYFFLNVSELHNLFNQTLPQIYEKIKFLDYAEYRRLIREMMIDCIKKHPGGNSLKMRLSEDYVCSIPLDEECLEDTVQKLIEENAKTVHGDSELFDPLNDPTRPSLAIEELAEKFIVDGKLSTRRYNDYLRRHHSCHEFDPLQELEVVKRKVDFLLKPGFLEEYRKEAEELFSRIQERLITNRTARESRQSDKVKILKLIKERLRELFVQADNYIDFLESKSGGVSFYHSERVRECNDLAGLSMLAMNQNDIFEQFEARRKISLALRMDRITKDGSYVFLDRNVESIKGLLRKYLSYNAEELTSLKYYDYPEGIIICDEENSSKDDPRYLREVSLIPAEFNGVRCWILPIFEGDKIEIIRKKGLFSILTKELRKKKKDDLAALTLVVRDLTKFEELIKLIQSDFLAYGKVLSIESKMGNLLKIRTKNVNINPSSSNMYRSVHYVVEMVVSDPVNQRDLITKIEIRVMLRDDLLKEKSVYHPASHQIYEQIRLNDVIAHLVPREIYGESYQVSDPDPWDIHNDKQIALKKKT